jgi:hypothetical protein
MLVDLGSVQYTFRSSHVFILRTPDRLSLHLSLDNEIAEIRTSANLHYISVGNNTWNVMHVSHSIIEGCAGTLTKPFANSFEVGIDSMVP